MHDRLPAIPGFDCERLLGQGAAGTVYLAREAEGLRRPVALKVFGPQQREAHRRELEVLRRVEEVRRRAGAAIVQALGTGEHEELGWIALEYLEGGSLQDLVTREGALDPAIAARYVAEAAGAVAALHEEGLFHRDVKPANLLLGHDGAVRLGDFGLSRELDGSLSAAGSPAFAAPEVIAGRPTDGRRVDVYSLGATLAYLLTGDTMLPGRPDAFVLERRGVPRPLQAVVVQAMATEPAERFATVEELVLALQAVTEASRTTPPERDEPSETRREPMTKDTVASPLAPASAAAPGTPLDLAVEHVRCPFCHEPVRASDPAKAGCSACTAWQHTACWSEHGRCAACGAEAAWPSLAKAAAQPAAPARRRPPRWAVIAAALAAACAALIVVLLDGTRERHAERDLIERAAAGSPVGIELLAQAIERSRVRYDGRVLPSEERALALAAVRAAWGRTLDEGDFSVLTGLLHALGVEPARELRASYERLLEHRPTWTHGRYQLAQALGDLEGYDAGEALRAIVRHDPDADVRFYALQHLRHHRDEITKALVLEILRQDRAMDVRKMAASVLGDLGDEALAPALLEALEREGWMTGNARAVALTALKQLTGLDYGDDLAAWRRALGVERPGGE